LTPNELHSRLTVCLTRAAQNARNFEDQQEALTLLGELATPQEITEPVVLPAAAQVVEIFAEPAKVDEPTLTVAAKDEPTPIQ
jgi:hypothetical protein